MVFIAIMIVVVFTTTRNSNSTGNKQKIGKQKSTTKKRTATLVIRDSSFQHSKNSSTCNNIVRIILTITNGKGQQTQNED